MFSARDLRPMLAVGGDPEPPLEGRDLVYEPKYDGIRAIVEVTVAPDRAPAVRIWSRNGNEKSAQFPDIVYALIEWAPTLPGSVVLDGEIVAVDAAGRPQGFQRLQHRINVSVPGYRSNKAVLGPDEQAAALIVFDLLRLGNDDLLARPLVHRRERLESLFEGHPVPNAVIRLAEQARASGRALHLRARNEGWEGLLVKAARSPYRAGRRSPEWRKLKLQKADDFVIAGWTEPQGSRARFGALVLGLPHPAPEPSSGSTTRPLRLRYVGDVGTGFSQAELERLWTLLVPLETDTCPFDVPPKTPGRAHWVTPSLVADVRYTEMTDEGRLRHPAYLGLREDKTVNEMIEGARGAGSAEGARGAEGAGGAEGAEGAGGLPRRRSPNEASRAKAGAWRKSRRYPAETDTPALNAVVEQLASLENVRKDGRLTLPDGDTLDVTNLHKIFWPAHGLTKGDLLRFYTRISPLILPVVANRPLVMKRLPDGVDGPAFYQHRAPEPVPRGVRIETLPDDDVPARLIGGSLKTLLYMAQLASISMDPWFSTIDALDTPDQVAIDLDPQPGATFAQILDVARWVYEVLESVGVRAFPKTSGSEGLHVYIPLPPGTPYGAGMLFCQIVATIVASRHPKTATVVRSVGKRQDQTVYVDYLQNIRGKTLACAYSARGSAFAGVSAPLTWDEVFASPAPQEFTLETLPERVRALGDLWAPIRDEPGADLLAAIDRLR
jgi:bifunctional non-homologous end joining protein LigD